MVIVVHSHKPFPNSACISSALSELHSGERNKKLLMRLTEIFDSVD